VTSNIGDNDGESPDAASQPITTVKPSNTDASIEVNLLLI